MASGELYQYAGSRRLWYVYATKEQGSEGSEE